MLVHQNLKDYTINYPFERIHGVYKNKAKKEISKIYFIGFLIIYPKNKDEGFIFHPYTCSLRIKPFSLNLKKLQIKLYPLRQRQSS